MLIGIGRLFAVRHYRLADPEISQVLCDSVRKDEPANACLSTGNAGTIGAEIRG